MATPPEEPANDVEEAVQDEAEEDDEVVKCVCGRTGASWALRKARTRAPRADRRGRLLRFNDPV